MCCRILAIANSIVATNAPWYSLRGSSLRAKGDLKPEVRMLRLPCRKANRKGE
jgi:hypothetical protein